MILGIDKVLELIKTKKLIEELDENNVNFEGCGVDLRIGEILFVTTALTKSLDK